MLPELDDYTKAYYAYQFRHTIDKTSEIDNAYHLAWEWLSENVDSIHLADPNAMGALREAAICNMRFRLARNPHERQVASFTMYGLIERYSREVASRLP